LVIRPALSDPDGAGVVLVRRLVAVDARLPIDQVMGSAEQLCVLQDHLNDVLVAVHHGALGRITVEVEYVHLSPFSFCSINMARPRNIASMLAKMFIYLSCVK